MFTRLIILLLLSSWCWGIEYSEARHLLARVAFGGTPTEIEQLLPMTYEEAVDFLLEGALTSPITPTPEDLINSIEKLEKNRNMIQAMTPEQRQMYQKMRRMARRDVGRDLKAWWYKEMIDTPSPFTERMTLFWHNHFTSSLRKVKFPLLMYQQNLTLRRYALGNFRDFVQAIAKDPAMILYLDNQTNRKEKPNENFARELLELFTLGEGNYTEQDIKQAARAFTGWMVERKTGEFVFRKRQHDEDEKTFMGRTGNFNGNDIVDIVLENPRTAVYIVTKLWKTFISEDGIDETEVNRIANIFRQANYEIKPLMRAFLTSSAFRNPKNYGQQIKSPVELVVGTIRVFNIPVDTEQLVGYGQQLGQNIFDPPNVKGWPGGKRWINTHTLMFRKQILQRGLRGMEMFISRFWVWHYYKNSTASDSPQLDQWLSLKNSEKLEKIQKLLLPISPVEPVDFEGELPEAIENIVLDLSYQLK